MKRRRWVRPVVIAALVLAVIVGLPGALIFFFLSPWDTIPSKADVVGVWRDGNTKRYLTLYPDGKLTFSNVPRGVVDESGSDSAGKTAPITVSGKWHAFYREGPIGPLTYYTVPLAGGTTGQLYENGNDFFGRTLVLGSYGYKVQIEYDFHRVSTTP